ncbi:DEAD/DEAH box helicase [Carboxylicivirga sediminis]|uniref:DEAD/DEAH box helicase n=1 Tax=Carboxylicivirga sediminis TaxID=2006564 RepID=A0A941F6J7_9BACT|nr:DEAD/DEAH box helicase [Carboxylicivirga sediminis]MBR8537457.1 DEAD/DEAH box helicase [Carboxylicivirga sediminis]
MKFEEFGLDEKITKSIDQLGYKRPTDIQFKAIPAILEKEDVLAIAQTGTGKSAAFVIPILQLLQKKRKKQDTGVRCIVMVPTHELAKQITDVFKQIGKNTSLKFTAIYGGVDQTEQVERLKKETDVLVATPGRLFDYINQGVVKVYNAEILVLDEADHMLDLGFYKDIQDLIKYLPKQRQTLFFSATIDKKIKKLAYSLVRRPIRIQISPKNPVAKNIDHSVAFIKMDDKRFFLERIIRSNPEKKILAFVRTKVRCERVLKAMERVDIQAVTIHSDKSQNERDEAMKDFKSGEIKLLIATDVSARGIDIPNVDYVVNYDLPEQPENYVHRVGRTGRGKQKGYAIAFCAEEEKELLETIENYTGYPIDVTDIDREEYADTIDFSTETHADWKTLMRQAEEDEIAYEAIKKKRAKKKKK